MKNTANEEPMQPRTFLHGRMAGVLLISLGVVSGVLACFSLAVHYQRIGVITLWWEKAPVSGIRHEIGFAYIAFTNHPDLSSDQHPSAARIFEDGKPLPGPANSLHDDIRQIGRGRYSFWHDYVYFSASDNSDPLTNGRSYTIQFARPIDNSIAHALYYATVLIILLIAGLFLYWMIHRMRGRWMPAIRVFFSWMHGNKLAAVSFFLFALTLGLIGLFLATNGQILFTTVIISPPYATLAGLVLMFLAIVGLVRTEEGWTQQLSRNRKLFAGLVILSIAVSAFLLVVSTLPVSLSPQNHQLAFIAAIGILIFSILMMWRPSRIGERFSTVSKALIIILRRVPALGKAIDEFSPALKNVSRSTPIHNIWLILFSIELLLAGFLLCVKAIFTGLNIPINVNWSGYSSLFPAAGISLFLAGIVLIAIPKVNIYLRYNKISAYLIPMHIWCLFVLIGMELFLRVTVYSTPLFYRQTNWFGWIPATGSTTLWGTEGYAITQYDGLGWEIHTPFQDGDNIIILGDSITEGTQVSDDQKFASVAEIVLRRDGYALDVHNLGRSGYSMADYVSWMNAYQSLYHPKIIVVELQQDDFIESFHEDKFNYFIADNSNIVDIVHQTDLTGNYFIFNGLTLGNPFLAFSMFGEQRIEQWNAGATVAHASSIPEAFDINLAKQQMDMLIKASNGTPLLLVLPPQAPCISGDRIIMNDPEQESLKGFLSNYYPQITLVDPLPEFQNLALSGYLPMGFFNSTLPGWGHLNPQGNRVLGELLAKTIEEVLK